MSCKWKTKHSGVRWDVWLTSCGHEYVEGRLLDNSPDNDEFAYCPYCSKRIDWFGDSDD